MGCAVSAGNAVKVDPKIKKTVDIPDIKTTNKWNITDEDKEIIRSSWHILKKDMTNNGLGIFLRIFQMCPKSKLLFDLERDTKDEDIKSLPKIRGHGFRFMQAIGASVEHIDDLDNTLTEILINLGRQHKHIDGFYRDYFDTFYDAIMGQWTSVLSETFSTSVLDAWGHLFVFIMEKLKEGYMQAI